MGNKSHFFRQSGGGGGDAFIVTFRTTTANESITLPYQSSGTYSGTIDWGDGTVVANSYVNRTHTYTTDGFYTVTILGDCVGWLFNNGGDKLKIYDIINWGIGFKFNNTLLPNGIFRGCANLNITAVDSLDLSNINYIVNLFRSCSNLQFNNSINDWDISSIERIEACFYFCNSFNQPLNNWDTTNVQRMTFLFGNCFAFNQDISAWDFSGLNNVNGLASFMAGKSSANYNAEYYDNLLIKWASDPSLGGLQPNIIDIIDMGTIKYTANGASARASILANNKAQVINDGGIDLFPKQLNPVVYINAMEGVNIGSNGRVDTVDDLSGNGYDFESVLISNNVGYEPNGINNLPSFEFNNDSLLQNEDTLTQITDLSQRFVWCVFKITDVNSGQSYHAIFTSGTNSVNDAGSNWNQLFNPNSTNNFINNYADNSLDATISDSQLTPKYAIIDKTSTQIEYTLNGVGSMKSGSYNVNNKNIYLGRWGSSNSGGKMLISEFGILNYTPTSQQIQDLKDYFQNTYNL